jgi:hypothetical protein
VTLVLPDLGGSSRPITHFRTFLVLTTNRTSIGGPALITGRCSCIRWSRDAAPRSKSSSELNREPTRPSRPRRKCSGRAGGTPGRLRKRTRGRPSVLAVTGRRRSRCCACNAIRRGEATRVGLPGTCAPAVQPVVTQGVGKVAVSRR